MTLKTLQSQFLLIPGGLIKSENKPILKLPANFLYKEAFAYALNINRQPGNVIHSLHAGLRLIFVYFVNDKGMKEPASEEEWRGAIKLPHSYLGIGRTRLTPFMVDVFTDIKSLPISELV